MSKNDAICLAEKFKAQAEAQGQAIYWEMAKQYYKEAGQYNMVIYCEKKANLN